MAKYSVDEEPKEVDMKSYGDSIKGFFKRIDEQYGLSIPVIIRWICLIPVVAVTFFGTGIASAMACGMRNELSMIWIGIPCAFTWVIVAYIVAPQYKTITSFVSWLIGAGVAAALIWPTYSYGEFMTAAIMPFGATCLSGLFAVGLTFQIEEARKG